MTVPRALMMAVKTAIQSRILDGSMSEIEEPSESSEEEEEEPSSFLLGVGVGSPAGLVVDGASGVVVAVAVAYGVVVSALATVTPDRETAAVVAAATRALREKSFILVPYTSRKFQRPHRCY